MLLPKYTLSAARPDLYLDSARLDEVHLSCHLTSPHNKIIFEVHLQEVGSAVRSHISDVVKSLLHVTVLHQGAESSCCRAHSLPLSLHTIRLTRGSRGRRALAEALQDCCAACGMLTVGLSWVTREVTNPGSASSKKGTQATRSWQMCRQTCTAGQGRAQDRNVEAAEGLPALQGIQATSARSSLEPLYPPGLPRRQHHSQLCMNDAICTCRTRGG